MTDLLGHCSCWVTYGVYFTEDDPRSWASCLSNLTTCTVLLPGFRHLSCLFQYGHVGGGGRFKYRAYSLQSADVGCVGVPPPPPQNYSSIKTIEVPFDRKQKKKSFWDRLSSTVILITIVLEDYSLSAMWRCVFGV
jgi:hypothetical protein